MEADVSLVVIWFWAFFPTLSDPLATRANTAYECSASSCSGTFMTPKAGEIKQRKTIKQMTARKWLTLHNSAHIAPEPLHSSCDTQQMESQLAKGHEGAARAAGRAGPPGGTEAGGQQLEEELNHATTFCCHFEYIFHFYDEEMSIVHWTGHSFICPPGRPSGRQRLMSSPAFC